MNKMMIYNKIAAKAQKDVRYYIHGIPSIGLIEDLLAFFGLEYVQTDRLHCEEMHRQNLKKLEHFICEAATDDQLRLIVETVDFDKPVPQPQKGQVNAGDVFVSMPMNKQKCADVDIIRAGIERGIIDSGNTPYFLDLDAHNGNICDKMLAEIVGCKFLIADFTTQNPGVYYEAGYAKALGKTVIHTCKQSDFDNVHFDLKQTQFVTWETPEDLAERLSMQIKKSNLGEVK